MLYQYKELKRAIDFVRRLDLRVFCAERPVLFDTLFSLGDKVSDPSTIFSFGFGMYIFSVFLGQISAIYVHQSFLNQLELLIIITYSIATFVLPFLRIEITRFLPDSAFRVKSVQTLSEDEPIGIKTDELPDHQDLAPAPADPAIVSNVLLSQRENEVLNLLLEGYPNELIASTLYISNNTLKKHIQSIYNKLGVHSRSELFLLMKVKS